MTGWTSEEVDGHVCEIFWPTQRHEHNFCTIYLHGVHGGRLADNQPFVDALEHHGLPVICPISGPSWWTDRIYEGFDCGVSAEGYVLNSVLPFVQSKFECVDGQIALFGTSMGGQGALKLAYKYPDRFPVVAAISPAVDFQNSWRAGDEALMQMYDDPEEARQDTATLHIHPLNWPRHQYFCCDPTDHEWFDSSDRLRMKLYSLGVPHEFDLETQAGGHGFKYYNFMATRVMEFLVERLNKERLRVV